MHISCGPRVNSSSSSYDTSMSQPPRVRRVAKGSQWAWSIPRLSKLEILRKLPFAPVTSPLFQISDFCPTDDNFLYGSNQSCWCLSFGFCFWFCFWLWLSSGFPLAHRWFPVSSCCSSLPTTRGRSFLSHHMTALGLSRKSRLFSKTSSISEEAPTGCRSVWRAERHHHSQ